MDMSDLHGHLLLFRCSVNKQLSFENNVLNPDAVWRAYTEIQLFNSHRDSTKLLNVSSYMIHAIVVESLNGTIGNCRWPAGCMYPTFMEEDQIRNLNNRIVPTRYEGYTFLSCYRVVGQN